MHSFRQSRRVLDTHNQLIIEFGREVASDDGAQHGTKIRRTLSAEAAIKPGLRLFPRLAPGEQALFAGFGQVKLLGATVGGGGLDLDQTVALERQNIATERSTVHDHFLGHAVDCHRTKPFQFGQD